MTPNTVTSLLRMRLKSVFAMLMIAGILNPAAVSAQVTDLEIYIFGPEGSGSGGHDFLFTEDDVLFDQLLHDGQRIVIDFEVVGGGNFDQWSFLFSAPPNGTFQPGHYPNVFSREIDVYDRYQMDLGCDGPGWFTIHEVERDGDALTRLSMDVTSFCGDTRDPAMTVRIRLNASADPPLKADSDGDGVDDTADNCPESPNPYQLNVDGDTEGDACDAEFNDSVFRIEPGIGPPGTTREPFIATPSTGFFVMHINDVLGGIETLVPSGDVNPYVAVRPPSGPLTVGTFPVDPNPSDGEMFMRVYDVYECVDPTGTVTIHEYEPDPLRPFQREILRLSLDYDLTCGGSVSAISGSVLWNATPSPKSVCSGHTPTHIGTSGDDTIIGTDGDDVILGKAGNDTILGGAGNDLICGGNGDDKIRGQAGRDIIEGGAGDDDLYGGTGADTAAFRNSLGPVNVDLRTGTATGSGSDTLASFKRVSGSDFNDLLIGSSQGDVLRGFDGNDILKGTSGNDKLAGGEGDDILYGGVGDDKLVGGEGNDVLFGKSGNDTLEGNAGNDLLVAGKDDDKLKGGSDNDVLHGESGDDILSGGRGDDSIVPGRGVDVAAGGPGVDLVSYSASRTAIVANLATGTAAGQGADSLSSLEWLQGSRFADSLTGSSTENWIFGERGADVIYGRGGNDVLFGSRAADQLFGGAGDDTLVGGPSNDILDGGAGVDAVSYYDAPSGVTVNLGSLRATGGLGKDKLVAVEDIVGGPYVDTLIGNSLRNWIEGRSSDDDLSGAGGDDILLGFGGEDSVSGGAGNDYLDGMFGDDHLNGGAGTDFCQERRNAINCEVFGDAAVGVSRAALEDMSPVSAQLPDEWLPDAWLPDAWWRAVPKRDR